MSVKLIGLFEAKTKLSEICTQVAANGQPVVLTRRGKPLVRIEAIRQPKGKTKTVWDRRVEYEKKHGALTEEFTLPEKEKQTWLNPLER
jgi:prevent-host-death family protein